MPQKYIRMYFLLDTQFFFAISAVKKVEAKLKTTHVQHDLLLQQKSEMGDRVIKNKKYFCSC